MSGSRLGVGARMSWVLGALCKAMATYAVSGALLGIAVGYSNWTKSPHSELVWQTVAFVVTASAVWWAAFAALVTLPLFLVLSATLSKATEISSGESQSSQAKARRKEVFTLLILPCAMLQFIGPLVLGALYLSIPPVGRYLQSWIPSGDLGDVLVRSSLAFMLLGSWASAAWLMSLWRSMAANGSPGVSRLLPLD